MQGNVLILAPVASTASQNVPQYRYLNLYTKRKEKAIFSWFIFFFSWNAIIGVTRGYRVPGVLNYSVLCPALIASPIRQIEMVVQEQGCRSAVQTCRSDGHVLW